MVAGDASRLGGAAKRHAALASTARMGSALALALLVAAPSCGKREARPEPEGEAERDTVAITCVAAQRGKLDRSVDLRGRVATQPGGDLPVASLVPGKVVKVAVEEGAKLKKGALVATVDDLEPRAATDTAVANVARARAAKAEADAALERTKKLEAEGIVSRADLESAQAKADAAAAELTAQESGVNLASGTLERTEVRSPFDGVVTKVWRGAGAVVDGTGATPIVEVAADSALEFLADATERELDLIAVGESADVELSATSNALGGSVLIVPPSVDPKDGLGTVRILLSAPSAGDAPKTSGALEDVRIGAFAHARIHAKSLGDALSIPRAALRGAILDGAEVALCRDGKAAIRKIAVGYRDAERVEVTSGLADGDRVAIGDVLGLSDGTAISEVAPSAAPPASEGPEP